MCAPRQVLPFWCIAELLSGTVGIPRTAVRHKEAVLGGSSNFLTIEPLELGGVSRERDQQWCSSEHPTLLYLKDNCKLSHVVANFDLIEMFT